MPTTNKPETATAAPEDRSNMAIYQIAEVITKPEITRALWYLAELIESTETVARRHNVPVPICHPHAKAEAARLGII